MWGNAGGDYVGVLAGLEGLGGNISADPLFCNPDAMPLSIRSDSPCAPYSPAHPDCGLTGASPVGCPEAGMPVADAAISGPRLDLFPNPLSGGGGVIRCVFPDIPDGRVATVAVCDVQGRIIRRLWSGAAPSGAIAFRWDGADQSGRPLPSGAYILVGASGGERTTRPVRIIR
jgi:hypothetical protein